MKRGPWGRHPAPASPADGPFWSDSRRVGGYRGDLDISPKVAEKIGLTLKVGRLRVRYWKLGWQPFTARGRSTLPAAFQRQTHARLTS